MKIALVFRHILNVDITGTSLAHDFAHLSGDQNTVFHVNGNTWSSRSPAGVAHSGVIAPVKQSFSPSVIQPNPQLIRGRCSKP